MNPISVFCDKLRMRDRQSPHHGPVTRFAPSPTGLLHLGHAYAALVAADAADSSGGVFLLRIDDIDRARSRAEFETAIYEDLSWLGLEWPKPVYRQSDHLDTYQSALAALDGLGVLYPCFCTRKQIQEEIARISDAPHGPEGALYPGTCRHLAMETRREWIEDGRSFALRIDVAQALATLEARPEFYESGAGPDGHQGQIAIRPELLGDVVLARRDIGTSYHLAVTVDDAAQGISLVTRGHDLFHATHMHVLLQTLLGLPTPDYAHHRLVRDAAGRRLAKRDAALSLRELRARGITPAAVREMALQRVA